MPRTREEGDRGLTGGIRGIRRRQPVMVSLPCRDPPGECSDQYNRCRLHDGENRLNERHLRLLDDPEPVPAVQGGTRLASRGSASAERKRVGALNERCDQRAFLDYAG